MIHAYDQDYVYEAQMHLGSAFYMGLVVCDIKIEVFQTYLCNSPDLQLFSIGSAWMIAGTSGIELAERIIHYSQKDISIPMNIIIEESNPAYWLGYYLAYYQWYTALSFNEIFHFISLEDLLNMYLPYHEMDIMHFVDELNRRKSLITKTKLKELRECAGYSQKELAAKSGVSLRNIELYEQRVNNIDKAQAKTLYALSKVLHCTIEDLLEQPNN